MRRSERPSRVPLQPLLERSQALIPEHLKEPLAKSVGVVYLIRDPSEYASRATRVPRSGPVTS